MGALTESVLIASRSESGRRTYKGRSTRWQVRGWPISREASPDATSGREREIEQPQPHARRPAPAIESQRSREMDGGAPGRAQRAVERLPPRAKCDAVD